jgi:threonine 3-dehydrogenase
MHNAGLRRAELPRSLTGEPHHACAAPVIGMSQSNDFSGPSVAARGEDRGFVCLCAAVREKRLLQRRSKPRELLRECDLGLIREYGRDVLQFVELGVNLRVYLLIAVANADRDNPAEEIQILIAIRIPNVLILRSLNDKGLLEVMKDGGKEELFLRKKDFLFGHGLPHYPAVRRHLESGRLRWKCMAISKTMKALVKSRPEPGLWLEDVPVPEIGINDVLVRVKKASICGTDIHILNWDAWAAKTIPVPMVIGHEFMGEIVAVGSNVSDFFPGQLVSGEGHVVCGKCRNCFAGRRHLCAHTSGVGVNRPGAFAEYISLPMTNVWVHKHAIDPEIAGIFDPFGNAVHTALAFPVLGEDVLVTGAGPIGIMAAAVAKHAGARHVVITDLNSYRLELARKVGVTYAVDPREKNLKQVQEELGMTEGFDVGLEMSGNASAFRDMLANMSHGGRIAMLGIPSEQIAIDWNTVIFNMLTIHGIYGREMYETWYKMTVMLESGLDISPVITHRFSYRDYRDAFDLMKSGNSGKIVLDWETI